MHCARLYARGVDDEIEAALQVPRFPFLGRFKVEKALTESSWAIELQRMWRLRLDLWRKLLSCPNWLRKKVTGLSKGKLETCNDVVLFLPERIQEIPYGTKSAARKAGGWGTSAC
ncbi:unnamed protein product [Prunus armeniaca]|uniref:Uncharacterized protein n=1 Tax=Prunus armeniaca TaxID=36596 RepID=A0A6J5XM17_PRUAR|nr:unnamed protein product [Prunus armeniaca]